MAKNKDKGKVVEKKTTTLYHAIIAPNGKEFDPEHARRLMKWGGGYPNNGGWNDKPIKESSKNAINKEPNTEESNKPAKSEDDKGSAEPTG